MSLLKADDLTVGYDSKGVVSGISFTVEQGDYLCIVGENGSGKTTLMKTLLGLIPPVKGVIETGEGLKAREIGYLPQQTEVQRDFPASVKEIVISGFQGKTGMRPFYSHEEKVEAEENMKRMGILDLEKRCYRDLSGGQQQRVLLARALCAAGRILLLDEPVAGLDPKVTSEMYDLIESLNKDGIAIIMISHDLAAAEKYASHILSIGDEVSFGAKEDFDVCDTCGQIIEDDVVFGEPKKPHIHHSHEEGGDAPCCRS